MPKRLLGALLAAVLVGNALALPQNASVPGGVALIDLGEAKTAMPQARFGEQPLAIVPHQGRWIALLGIPLDSAVGKLAIEITQAGRTRQHDIDVKTKDYPTQRLTVKDQRKVTPDPDDLIRIEREKAHTDQIKRQYRDSQPDPDFIQPAAGPLSSRFGLRRIFNGEPRNPHAGLDVAAGTGTPVVAPADAVVADIGEYFFNGNTVFLDHGRGLISAYMHLSQTEVKVGQRLTRGQKLGAIGATGRVTGPHLHWAVFLNGTAVDPELFLKPSAKSAPTKKARH